jgi:hypothetical protein
MLRSFPFVMEAYGALGEDIDARAFLDTLAESAEQQGVVARRNDFLRQARARLCFAPQRANACAVLDMMGRCGLSLAELDL